MDNRKRITFLDCASTSNANFVSGKSYELSEKFALEMIRAGIAVDADPKTEPKEEKKETKAK